MATEELENVNPNVFDKLPPRLFNKNDVTNFDPVDSREIFDMVCAIRDPEHPMSLEELGIINLENILVDNEKSVVHINFTPTIPHCSMATLIGLSIRVKLIRTLASRFKVAVEITPGTHSSELAINKQLADKERIAAAMENKHLSEVINQCICFNDKLDINKICDNIDVLKHNIFSVTYNMLKKLEINIVEKEKFLFLKHAERDIYKGITLLENLSNELEVRSKLTTVLNKITEHDILSDFTDLSNDQLPIN